MFRRTFKCLLWFGILNCVTLSLFCEDLGQLSLCSDWTGWMILSSKCIVVLCHSLQSLFSCVVHIFHVEGEHLQR